MFNQNLDLTANLDAVVIRADGSHRDANNISGGFIDQTSAKTKIKSSMSVWRRFWQEMRDKKVIPMGLGLAAFIQAMHSHDLGSISTALVTTTGVNYMAADFLSGSSNHIAAFNYHDCGTGTTAAAIADTALQTPAGITRVAGTQSNPVAGQYRSVGTISFTSTAAITEFGLFSAASAGTMWDHRVFSVINVNNGDSIQFTYTVTITAGGS